jgi:predicted SprT family Zn-dependent metalloprotease
MNTVEFWNPIAQASFEDTWANLRKLYGDKVGAEPNVEWSKRMKKGLGVAYYNNPEKPDFIRLSVPNFWAHPEAYVLEVIPHELAHIAAWRLFEHSGHGKPWREIMDALGFHGVGPYIQWETLEKHKENFWKNRK